MPESKKYKISGPKYMGNVDKIEVSSNLDSKKVNYQTKDIKTSIKKEIENSTKKERKNEQIAVPLTFYWFKEWLREFANNKYFPDAMLSFFALLSVSIAFPFYPIIILIPLLVLTFFLSRYHPLAGLMALLFITFPIYMYQAPLLAWFYAFFLTIALVFGFKHYRSIIFAYTLIVLPFSAIGYVIEIPIFVLGILYIGMKRSLIATTLAIMAIPVISALTGITAFAPITYNVAGFRSMTGATPAFQLLSPSKTMPTLSAFPSDMITGIESFLISYSYITEGIYLAFSAFAYGSAYILIQLVVWLVVVLSISLYVMKHRSIYKSSESSLYALAILVVYAVLLYYLGGSITLLSISGFIVAPLFLLILEFNDIDIVRVLDVMKRDFLSTFGESFEELSYGVKESLSDIGNYDQTKNELTEAILQPIEHKGISGAYNIKPSKGILLFGPPGTGKTMLMRAISKEIRARFIYVKASSIISSSPGDSSKALSKIFDSARAHTPTVLFFDEIDGISAKRADSTSESNRELLSDLLSEMDGFQKIDGVVIVGSTNVPNLIDSALLRPGRFDRIIYMPLPDKSGRLEIFKKYAAKYPVSSDLDYEKLAKLTSRFSGADISAIFSETAAKVAGEAIKNSKPLKIQTSDLLTVISSVKPSTSLSQLELYEKFKIDFERRLNPELVEKKQEILLDDVINISEAKKALDEAIRIPLEHPNLVKSYKIKNITGILLYGPPGCGKTMLMKAVSNQYSDIKLIHILGSDLSKEGYDNAVNTIKESFLRAKENAPSVIFIDEIDSLVPDRSNTSELGIKITSEFLREFEELKETEGVVLVGATNRPEAIDPALIRPGRLDKLIYVKPPGKDAREELFRKTLVDSPIASDINFATLSSASSGYTGAEIVEICREAKMQALEKTIEQNGDDYDSENKEVLSMDMLLSIIKKTKPQASKIILSKYDIFESEHLR